MGKNKQNSEFLKRLAENFEECVHKHKDEKKGCIILAYDADFTDGVRNAYLGAGKPTDLAECVLGCMKQDQMLAHLILAAGTAYMNAEARKLEEYKMKSETPAN